MKNSIRVVQAINLTYSNKTIKSEILKKLISLIQINLIDKQRC